MRTYQHIFGPVPSRRLGRSLGVDLTPMKTCTLDCIFCQLGRTTARTTERREYIPVKEVVAELAAWLQGGGTADYITLAGSGEPTLHSRFGDVIEQIRHLTRIPVALLTNGTLLHLPEVRQAAGKADVVKITLSASTKALFSQIHRPCRGVTLSHLLAGARQLRTEFPGQLWLEVFLLWGINSTPAEVQRIAALAETVKPDRLQLNTCVRPPAETFALAVPPERLQTLAPLFRPPAEVIAEFTSGQPPLVQVNVDSILALLQRRPCTAPQIAQVFDMHANEVSKYLGQLLRAARIRPEKRHADMYYAATPSPAHVAPGGGETPAAAGNRRRKLPRRKVS